ncbi:glycosyltransferase family 4 protein [Micromonospora echinospora]|uniref:glycosyltransferase family 4 protein n=1 Tax=Micromonospora echinospora TaxID=1877 RepID=UPI00341EE0F4
MRHLLVLSGYRLAEGRSGEAVHLRELTRALTAAGHRTTVLDGPLHPGRPVSDPQTELGPLRAELDRLLRADRPDAALLWPGADGEETPLVDRLVAAGVRLVVEHPAADLPPAAGTLERADEVVVPSAYAREQLAAGGGPWAHVVAPMSRPCDCPAVRPPVGRRGPVRVTFVNPEPAKGLGVVLTLAGVAAARRLPFRFRLVEGRWTAVDLRRVGVDPDRCPNVEVTPFREDVCALYAETDLLLAPSLWRESFGMVAREATLHGLPVLATRVGGLPEAVGAGGVCLDPPASDADYAVTMSAAEIRRWLEAMVAAVRGDAPQVAPGLRARAAAATVAAYQELLDWPTAVGTGGQART